MATAKHPARRPAAPARKAAAKKATVKAARAPAPAKGNGASVPEAAKPPKVKLVRDSFTIPRDEYAVIDALKLRAARLGRITKKSELLRAGLKLLAACKDAGLLGALDAVPQVKTGRPKGKRHGKDTADAEPAGT